MAFSCYYLIMLNFLSTDSHRLVTDFLPLALEMTSHRIVNYLSFYLSHRGKHLYHHKDILSQKSLRGVFASSEMPQSQFGSDEFSVEHLLAKQILSLHFQEHIMDERGAMRMHAGLGRLAQIGKKDFVEDFLGSRCRFFQSGRIIPKMDIHPRQRKNIYIHHSKRLPSPPVLEQLLTLNPFYQLGNLNKILVFGEDQTTSLHLPAKLEQFCLANHIRIKLLKKNSVCGLLEYVTGKEKRNILVHQTVNDCREIYDLKTPEDRLKKQNGKEYNPVFWRMMPREIVLLCQRLPKESVASKTNEKEVMNQMRTILDRQPGQELIDSELGLPFSAIEKNYLFEDIGGVTVESKQGFLVKRYVSIPEYKQNRRPQNSLSNPFAQE